MSQGALTPPALFVRKVATQTRCQCRERVIGTSQLVSHGYGSSFWAGFPGCCVTRLDREVNSLQSRLADIGTEVREELNQHVTRQEDTQLLFQVRVKESIDSLHAGLSEEAARLARALDDRREQSQAGRNTRRNLRFDVVCWPCTNDGSSLDH